MIYIINGFPRSGKDVFCEYVNKIMGTPVEGTIISTVDPIKNIAKQIGWDGKKTPAVRKFLSELKKLTKEFNNYPVEYVKKEVANIKKTFSYWLLEENEYAIFIMCREPEEIEELKQIFNAKTILMRRPGVEKLEQSNQSDTDVLNYKYDYEIDNSSGLYQLAEAALEFIKQESLKANITSIQIDFDGNLHSIRKKEYN